MSTTAIAPKEFEQKIAAVVQDAKAIKIADQSSYEIAGRFVLEYVNPILKELDRTFDPIIDQTNKAHKEAVAQKKRHSVPMLEARAIATEKCRDYQNEQLRIQRENDRIAEEAARKQEEDERLKEAEAAQKAGVSEKEVDAILETPIPTTAVKATPTFTRMKGLGREKPYSTEVFNLALLVMHIAGVKRLAHPELLNYLMANGPALNSAARAQEENFHIPGVRSGRGV